VLASLLPGVRELRAPLAAGYLWLLSGWLAWTPECGDSALTDAMCRLDSLVSVLGVAVVTGFAAFLVGALSIAFCSAPLRGLLQARPPHGRVRRTDPLSPGAWSTLRRLAAETVERMSIALAFTDTRVREVLDEVIPPPPPPRRHGLPIRRRRPPPVAAVMTADSVARPDAAEADARRLSDAMALELDRLVTLRLLGRDPELFAAIDRHRAEVELRLAVIPALLVLFVVVAARTAFPASAVVLVVGIAVAAGLAYDAVTRQRRANEELTAAIDDGRVISSLRERAEVEAATRADRTKADKMRAAASKAANALREAIDRAAELDSTPSRMGAARDAVTDTQGHMRQVELLFPVDVSDAGGRAVHLLNDAVRLFESPEGEDPDKQSRRKVGQSRLLASQFRDAVLAELDRMKPPAPATTAAADGARGSPAEPPR
jgi:hypothetical protein